jgi:uncharacterized phage protein gp47/JayE
LSVNTIETPTGWGYTITQNDKIIIKQTIIPAVENNSSFKSKRDAMKVGELVLQKLINDLSPTVTKNDLILLSIKI